MTLVPVRVLDCTGSATPTSGRGHQLDRDQPRWPVPRRREPEPRPRLPAPLDAAVNALIADGVTAVVAAGNDPTTLHPRPARSTRHHGAPRTTRCTGSFSNYGPCPDLFAPGVEHPSAGSTTDTATATMSGTSMASPHVAGAAALILGVNTGFSPAQVTSAIMGCGQVTVHVHSGRTQPWTRTSCCSPTPVSTVTAPGAPSGSGGRGRQCLSTTVTWTAPVFHRREPPDRGTRPGLSPRAAADVQRGHMRARPPQRPSRAPSRWRD